jgi:hypothetical protein
MVVISMTALTMKRKRVPNYERGCPVKQATSGL